MKQPLEDRAIEIVSEVSNGHFPTYNQLKIMLKAEGYSAWEVDRWFAARAAELMEGAESAHIRGIMHSDVYLVMDQQSKTPLAFWIEGQSGVLPLEVSKPESWRAANELRNTLKTEGMFANK